MATPAKNTICLWYDRDAEDAARFYAKTFPDSSVGAVHRAPGDFPSGKKGDVLTVDFSVMGIPCMGLNGGPEFKHNEAFSFQVATTDQAETDRYWNAIIENGGEESQCGWCKDKWGLSWQITPIVLSQAITHSDPAVAKRRAVVIERREHERKCRHPKHDQRSLEQHDVDLAAREPRIQKEQHEREDRDARRSERIRAGGVGCGEIGSHGRASSAPKHARHPKKVLRDKSGEDQSWRP